MKFVCQVKVSKSRDQLVNLWEKEENLVHWQDGYIRSEPIEGETGKEGAKTKMIYQIGKRKLELIETIIENSLPEFFEGLYEAPQMINTMKNNFDEIDDHNTLWTAEINYTKMNGFMVRLMAFFAPSIFKKQTQKWLNQFKSFAEKS